MKWLLKAEPNSRIVSGIDVKYTIDDLKLHGQVTYGRIRNYEARKHLIAMKPGDEAFFYRSNCKEPAIVGTMTVLKPAYPDPAATNPNSPFYDPKNGHKWVVVDFKYQSHLNRPVTLREIKQTEDLQDMALVKRFRLSVTPVTDEQWQLIMKMSETVN